MNRKEIKVPSGSKAYFVKGISIENALIIRSNIARLLNKDSLNANELYTMFKLAVENKEKEIEYLEPIISFVLKLLCDREFEKNLQNIIAICIEYNGAFILPEYYEIADIDDPLYKDLHYLYYAILEKCLVPLLSGLNGILQFTPQNPKDNTPKK